MDSDIEDIKPMTLGQYTLTVLFMIGLFLGTLCVLKWIF